MCGLFIFLHPKEKELLIEVSLVELSQADLEAEDAPKLVALPAPSRLITPIPLALKDLPEAPATETIKEEKSEITDKQANAEIALPELEVPVFEAPEIAHVEAPKTELKSALKPKYPRNARKRGEEGIVQVEVTVNEEGKVIAARVAVSSGFAELDKAALVAIKQAEFSPVAGMALVRIEFRLQNK